MSGICDTCKREPCHMRFDGCKTCDIYEGGETRYEQLFGTPERAARTLAFMDVDVYNWCVNTSGNPKDCRPCPYEFDRYGCCLPDGFSLLEWLRGDAE